MSDDPPKPFQEPSEIAAFLEHIAAYPEPPRSIIEIGVMAGGTLAAFGEKFPGAERVGVDVDPQPSAYEQGARLVLGRSQDKRVQAKVRAIRQQFDLVFIDGDHSEEGTMADLEFAMSLHPRWIALHDITCRTHAELACWKVWDALVKYAPRLGRRTFEFKSDPDWWGIGLVEMPS